MTFPITKEQLDLLSALIMLLVKITGAFGGLKRVAAIAQAAKITVCAVPLEKDLWMMQDITVVWHGVGATSYLRLAASGKSVLIPLPSNEVDTIRMNPKPDERRVPAKSG